MTSDYRNLASEEDLDDGYLASDKDFDYGYLAIDVDFIYGYLESDEDFDNGYYMYLTSDKDWQHFVTPVSTAR